MRRQGIRPRFPPGRRLTGCFAEQQNEPPPRARTRIRHRCGVTPRADGRPPALALFPAWFAFLGLRDRLRSMDIFFVDDAQNTVSRVIFKPDGTWFVSLFARRTRARWRIIVAQPSRSPVARLPRSSVQFSHLKRGRFLFSALLFSALFLTFIDFIFSSFSSLPLSS